MAAPKCRVHSGDDPLASEAAQKPNSFSPGAALWDSKTEPGHAAATLPCSGLSPGA